MYVSDPLEAAECLLCGAGSEGFPFHWANNHLSAELVFDSGFCMHEEKSI